MASVWAEHLAGAGIGQSQPNPEEISLDCNDDDEDDVVDDGGDDDDDVDPDDPDMPGSPQHAGGEGLPPGLPHHAEDINIEDGLEDESD